MLAKFVHWLVDESVRVCIIQGRCRNSARQTRSVPRAQTTTSSSSSQPATDAWSAAVVSAETTGTSGVLWTTWTSWSPRARARTLVDSEYLTPGWDRTVHVLPTSRPTLKQATTVTQASNSLLLSAQSIVTETIISPLIIARTTKNKPKYLEI